MLQNFEHVQTLVNIYIVQTIVFDDNQWLSISKTIYPIVKYTTDSESYEHVKILLKSQIDQ